VQFAIGLSSGLKMVIVTPDSREKTEIKIAVHAGLPTPSPDAQSIAYEAFVSRVR
jgi:hypothetical protein